LAFAGSVWTVLCYHVLDLSRLKRWQCISGIMAMSELAYLWKTRADEDLLRNWMATIL